MRNYIIKRLLQTIPVLLLVTMIVFSLMFVIPGDPATTILGEEASPAEIHALREQMGLNRPVLVQYLDWVTSLLRGDLGVSYQDGREVFPTLISRMPATIELVILSMVIAMCIGVPVGVFCALKRNSFGDAISRIFALLGISMPNFWVALMLILVFSYHLRWLPASGRGSFSQMLMPALALGTSAAGLITRMTRSTMLEVISQDYIRTAKAKGLRESVVIYKHAIKNALLSVLTVVGLQIGDLLGGAVVTESIFAYPGIGRFSYQRLLMRDFPMVMGNLFLFAFMFMVINLITDVLYGLLDPRIRYD